MNMKEIINTCQICARPIKANTGLTAHHGYQRPGGGWQTASCIGARYLPYEQSCDRIPVAIEAVKEHIRSTEVAINNLVVNPPETITRYGDKYHKDETFPRPEGFDPNNLPVAFSNKQQYELEFVNRKYYWEREIKYCKNDLEFLEERLKNWVAPK